MYTILWPEVRWCTKVRICRLIYLIFKRIKLSLKETAQRQSAHDNVISGGLISFWFGLVFFMFQYN